MKNLWRFSRTERVGLGVLGVLVIAAHGLPTWWHTQRETPVVLHTANSDSTAPEAGSGTGAPANAASVEELVPRPIDPNTASASDFQAIGISARAANNIVRYRERGGKYRKPEDLQKIYTLSDEEFRMLLPWLRWPEPPAQASVVSLPEAPAAITKFFDPNTADEATMIAAGVSARAARGIANYRAKGGVYRTAQDIQKIYSITPDEFERIAPWVQVSPDLATPSFGSDGTKVLHRKERAEKTYPTIDLNTSTAEQLDELPGIGATYAARILKYRDALGGFVSTEQVREVRGLPDSVYQKIKPYITISTLLLRRLNINTASVEELEQHPYLNRQQAKAIVEYRSRKGTFQQVEVLQVIDVLNDEKQTFVRVKPYLSL